jgi:RNA recognition motif-containing protein
MLQNEQQEIDGINAPNLNQAQKPPTNPQQQPQPPFPPHPHQPHLQQHPQQQFGHAPPDCTIWMGDLCPDWDAAYIREAFGQYGKDIANVKMVTTDQGARVYFFIFKDLFIKLKFKKATYCFVEFSDEESARNALLDVNGKPVIIFFYNNIFL